MASHRGFVDRLRALGVMDFTEHDIEAIATGWFRIHRELDETRVLPGPSSKNV